MTRHFSPQELSEDEEDAYDEEEGVKGRVGKTGFEEDMDIIAGDGSYVISIQF